MDINNTKILVFTVDCWSNATGANTMSSLFSWCDRDKIANIYIRTDIPTYTKCDRYFQICENNVIKSILARKTLTGRRVFPNVEDNENIIEHNLEKERYRKFRTNNPWILRYLREILWFLGKWKSKELENFILDFNPDVIVFAYEGLIHFNRIVRYAINLTGAKAIGYFWDDNFTYKQYPGNLGYYLYRFFQRRDIKKTVKLSSANFSISPKTKEECDAFFGIDSILLTKPMVCEKNIDVSNVYNNPIQILYTGNLGIGRFDSLAIVSSILSDFVNQFELWVYTNTVISDKQKALLGNNTHLCGSVPQDEVINLQKKADILLFMEDVVGKNKRVARLSFSTKLADYFAAGKCILALGDADIAPIEYLRNNDAALVAYSREDLYQIVKRLSLNAGLISEYSEKALALGKKNHSNKLIKKIVIETITGVIE